MKKIILLLFICLFGMAVHAENTVLTGEAAFDWINVSQAQRDAKIQYYKAIIFGAEGTGNYSRREFKKEFKDVFKDENHKEHYRLADRGVEETEDAKLCAFYYKDLLVSYAVQYKNNMKKVYYYDALGHLKFVDMMSDAYPNFPYWSKQYKASGKLGSAIYFISHDMQYMYEPDGKFKGLWYKNQMYDRHAKPLMTRTNW